MAEVGDREAEQEPGDRVTATCSRCHRLRHDVSIYASSTLFKSGPTTERLHTNTLLCELCHQLVTHQ